MGPQEIPYLLENFVAFYATGENEMTIEYVAGNSFLHRLDPRVKMAFFAAVVVIMLCFTDPILLGIMFLMIYTLGLAAKIPSEKINRFFKGLIPILIVYFVSNVLLGPVQGKLILFYIIPSANALPITIEAILYSTAMLFRFIIIILAVRIITLVTKTIDLVLGLIKLKLPPEFGVALSIGFAYIPILTEAFQQIVDAQKARALEFEGIRNPIKKVRKLIPLIIPMIMASTKRGQDIAVAIESRGFGYNISKRTYINELKFNAHDSLFLALVIASAIGSVILHLTGYGSYESTLRLVNI